MKRLSSSVVAIVVSVAAATITTGAALGRGPAATAQTAVCHETGNPSHWVTITVDRRAVPAHLRHGDKLGACPKVSPTTATTPAKTHGRQKKDDR